MKRILIAFFSAALILASCGQEMEITITETEKETDYTPCEKLVSVKASVDEGLTKVSSDNVGAFKWQSGDVITVVTDNNAIRQFSTNDSDLTADFSGMIPDTDNIGKYAMYPASVNHFALDDALLFHIDNIMTWRADASNMPMLGKISGSATFKAVGGALKLVLYNIPVDADTLLFSSTNKQISGEFEIEDATIAAPVIATAAKESKNNELKIDFSANYSASKVFYIPLPTGTIDGFTVSLLNEDGDELFSKTTTASLTVTANKLIIGPALNCSVALWEEDWTGYAKDDLPSSKDDREGLGGASITYTQTNGVGSSAGITKIYTEDSAGGSSPELLVGKKGTGTGAAGGTFTASGIPTDGETSMILIFKHKKTVGISLTDGITAAKTSFTSDGEESVVLTNTESLASFDITFTATTTDNVRLDDIKVIKGYSAPVITAPNTLTFSVGSTTKTGTVSISNSVDNLGISTVLSGDDYSWVSSVSISGTTLTVEATDINTTASARTATLTLKATGAASKAITITQPTALVSKPATISVVPGNASFSASWTKADHSTGYKAYLHTAETATPATGGTELTPSLDGSTYSVSRSGLTNGSTYYLYVKVNEVEENYVAEDAFKMVSFVPSNTIYYEKVTEDLDDWSGDYLIVWGSNAYYATDGTDFKTNAEVSISNGKIASTGHNSHKVTIEKVSTNYYIKLPSGKYMYNSSNSGRDVQEGKDKTQAYTFSYLSTPGTVEIVGGESKALMKNSSYFRFYVTTNSYDRPMLFKLNDPRSEAGLAWKKSGVAANSDSATMLSGDDTMPTIALDNPNSLTVTYSSSVTSVATINSSTGALTLVGAGSTVISAEFADGDATYKPQTVSYTLSVTDSRTVPVITLTTTDVELTDANYNTFTGRSATVDPSVTLVYSKTDASSIIDEFNTSTGVLSLSGNTGSATVTVSFAGNAEYKPAVSKSYTIKVASSSGPVDRNVPGSPTITAISPTSFTATWTAPASGGSEDGYSWKLSEYSDPTAAAITNGTGNVATGVLTVTVSSGITLSTDKDYYFHVLTRGDGGTNYNDSDYATSAAKQYHTQKWTASSGAIAGTTSGTIENGDYDWSFTRSSVVYTGWSSDCIQLGSKSGAEAVSLTNSNYSGTIISVAVECSSYNGAHKVAISVGGNSYLASTATASWTTVSTKTGTGTSSGNIQISFTDGSRALYIKSITVIYY